MPTTISKLKTKLDKIFSEYIRRRYANHDGTVSCFTCGIVKHWKEQQAGHFQSRRSHSTRWDEKNVQVQCPRCNLFNQGEQYKFGNYLDNTYGHGTAEELEQRAKTIVKLTRVDYEEAIELYKRKLEEL
tara:strand:- start:2009 stop:2395 length:387 start_codon:yes stop_codon:yes gene_type:complete